MVDVAPNGRIAVEMAQANDYDAILMDVQMPEMNGYDATRAIRAWKVTSPDPDPGHDRQCDEGGTGAPPRSRDEWTHPQAPSRG
ncbi:MAG: response regulator [Flavobacteriales bacterium]|nr:response regulator [Flavobacteriales bacterium]